MTTDELSAVRENIKSLLVTNWGERPMHYDMGCNLIEFLFENDRSEELREKIADRILSQITKWMPFVTIDELNVLFPDDDPTIPENRIAVRIKFSLVSRPNLSSLLVQSIPA